MKNILIITQMLIAVAFFAKTAAAEDCTVVECAQKAVEAAYQAKLAFKTALPKGAVMAFNLASCPNGWKEYEALRGRVIVGSGQGIDAGNSALLTSRSLNSSGGEEKHQLTVAEMPSHQHSGEFGGGPHSYEHHQNNHRLNGENPKKLTGATGGNTPHNNMQPFHVLMYCERL
ncbi:MAG: hypothetical protein ACI9SP_001473 [Arenicella sp.]|jgi:hypothetical protein